MSVLEVEQLLEPISPDSPCGENLEYDADFGELERAAQGTPEQQFGNTVVEAQEPDWKDVPRQGPGSSDAPKICGSPSSWPGRLVRLDGLPGFRDALAVLRGLVERFWQDVHPQLDPDDDLDPALRVNALAALCDNRACLKAGDSNAPMVESAGAWATFSYRRLPGRRGRNAAPRGRKPGGDADHRIGVYGCRSRGTVGPGRN